MRRILLVYLFVLGLMLSWSLTYAADFYVIPVQKCCTCKGTLNGTRWCDNGDGTVTDLTTCLVWLKNASWGGGYAFWVSTAIGTNAHDRAAQLKDGVGGLTDGSVEGNWRLPTKTELVNLVNNPEAVSSFNMRVFTGVQSENYWSSTTLAGNPSFAWVVHPNNGNPVPADKGSGYYVWPIRGGQ